MKNQGRLRRTITMDGNHMDINEFLRKSIEENEKIAREFLLEERRKKIEKLSYNNGIPSLFKDNLIK